MRRKGDLEETVGAASPVDLGDDAELVRRGEVDEGDVAVGGHLGEARPVGLGPGIALREGVVARNSGKKLVRHVDPRPSLSLAGN